MAVISAGWKTSDMQNNSLTVNLSGGGSSSRPGRPLKRQDNNNRDAETVVVVVVVVVEEEDGPLLLKCKHVSQEKHPQRPWNVSYPNQHIVRRTHRPYEKQQMGPLSRASALQAITEISQQQTLSLFG
jgi:hypothetical protein